MDKERRQQVILELIGREDFANQEELRRSLRKMGYGVTQATLSRDLRELNVVKTAVEHGSYRYTVLENWKGPAVLQCEASGNLIVLRTENGMAPAIAYRIDDMNWPALLGSVAGEDTVLVVVAEGHDAKQVKKALWKRIQEI